MTKKAGGARRAFTVIVAEVTRMAATEATVRTGHRRMADDSHEYFGLERSVSRSRVDIGGAELEERRRGERRGCGISTACCCMLMLRSWRRFEHQTLAKSSATPKSEPMVWFGLSPHRLHVSNRGQISLADTTCCVGMLLALVLSSSCFLAPIRTSYRCAS